MSIGASLPVGTHLAVVWWHQRSGEFDEYFQIAKDVPLVGSVDAVEIQLAEVATPYAENLICFRDCPDRSICQCAERPHLAVGSVILAIDRDGDGSLSFAEVRQEQFGIANVFIGWSSQSETGVPRGLEIFAPVDIPAGKAPLVANLTGTLEAVTVPTQFAVLLCPPGDESCSLPIRGRLCRIDCERHWGLNRLGF